MILDKAMEQEQLTLEQLRDDFLKLKKDVEGLKSLKEDLELVKDIDEAWDEVDKGDVVEVSRENLSEELKKW